MPITVSVVLFVFLKRVFGSRFLVFKTIHVLGVIACGVASPLYANPHLPGGHGSAEQIAGSSFAGPLANISDAKKRDFYAGRALAQQPWIKAPATTTARDGLGPLYNARTCLACHIGGSRGVLPTSEQGFVNNAVVKISQPGSDPINGVVADATYGDQLQTQSTALLHQLKHTMPQPKPGYLNVKPEAYITVRWQRHPGIYPDGNHYELRAPVIVFDQLGYGPLPKNTLWSLRVAPPLLGLGLLEAVAPQDILALADPKDVNKDGISGRLNRVWDFNKKQRVAGRFGAKAARPDLLHVVAAALAKDMGITNSLFSVQPCSKKQIDCLNSPTGNDGLGVEISQHLLELIEVFTAHVVVPKARPLKELEQRKAQQLFHSLGCASCHTPSFKTQHVANSPMLSEQLIWPYSDLLLHDLGPGLADNFGEYEASGSEWRTAPLWGIGITKAAVGEGFLLHDGRARSVEEAILWHGGEAQGAQTAFKFLSKSERTSVIQFVETL